MNNEEHLKLKAMRILQDLTVKAEVFCESFKNGMKEFEKDKEGYRNIASKDKELQEAYAKLDEILAVL